VKLPVCKVCGAAHSLNEPHQWSGPRESSARVLPRGAKMKDPDAPLMDNRFGPDKGGKK